MEGRRVPRMAVVRARSRRRPLGIVNQGSRDMSGYPNVSNGGIATLPPLLSLAPMQEGLDTSHVQGDSAYGPIFADFDSEAPGSNWMDKRSSYLER